MAIDPARYIEVKNNNASPMLFAAVTPAVANNTGIVTGVTGKKIRVHGLVAQSAGASGSLLFKSASGGTTIFPSMVMPANTANPFVLEIKDSGYFETNAGEGLFVDVATTQIQLLVCYSIYTP